MGLNSWITTPPPPKLGQHYFVFFFGGKLLQIRNSFWEKNWKLMKIQGKYHLDQSFKKLENVLILNLNQHEEFFLNLILKIVQQVLSCSQNIG